MTVWMSPHRRKRIIEESASVSRAEVVYLRDEILRVQRDRFWTLLWTSPASWMGAAPTELARSSRRAVNAVLGTVGGSSFAHWSKRVPEGDDVGEEEWTKSDSCPFSFAQDQSESDDDGDSDRQEA